MDWPACRFLSSRSVRSGPRRWSCTSARSPRAAGVTAPVPRRICSWGAVGASTPSPGAWPERRGRGAGGVPWERSDRRCPASGGARRAATTAAVVAASPRGRRGHGRVGPEAPLRPEWRTPWGRARIPQSSGRRGGRQDREVQGLLPRDRRRRRDPDARAGAFGVDVPALPSPRAGRRGAGVASGGRLRRKGVTVCDTLAEARPPGGAASPASRPGRPQVG